MSPTINDIEERLNKLYWTDSEKYLSYLDMIKGMGYKVLRNSKGNHKVQSDISSMFGGAFGDIYN